MLRNGDYRAVEIIRKYFDDIAYHYLNTRYVSEHFPGFPVLQSLFQNYNDLYKLILSVFRQGHSVESTFLRQAIPPEVLDAMVACGLLIQTSRGHWRTPGLAVIVVEGLYLAIKLPAYYPTHTENGQVYIPDALLIQQAIPGNLRGMDVVNPYAGNGLAALICAARGANSVIAIEKSEVLASLIGFNAVLNGFSDIISILHKDLGFESPEGSLDFDFFISSPPCLPIKDDLQWDANQEIDFSEIQYIDTILREFPAYMNSDSEGYIFSTAFGGQHWINYNRDSLPEIASQHNLKIRSYIAEKVSTPAYFQILADNYISCSYLSEDFIQEDFQERYSLLSNWLEFLSKKGTTIDYVYTQLIRFQNYGEVGFANWPFYKPEQSDPLLKLANYVQAVH